MRTVTLCMILLCSAWSFSGAAADPPAAPAKPAPAPAPAAVPGASSSTPPTTVPAAKAPGTAPQPAGAPDRIEPTEKVHADSEISFPVDI